MSERPPENFEGIDIDKWCRGEQPGSTASLMGNELRRAYRVVDAALGLRSKKVNAGGWDAHRAATIELDRALVPFQEPVDERAGESS